MVHMSIEISSRVLVTPSLQWHLCDVVARRDLGKDVRSVIMRPRRNIAGAVIQPHCLCQNKHELHHSNISPAGSFHMRSGKIPSDSVRFDARSASGRRPEHVGGPRRPKAAAPSFARVRRVKQGVTSWEANEKSAESSADKLGFQ